MRRRIAFSVLVIAALLASATPAFANGSVDVYPGNPGPFYATSADSIHFFWGWVALTKGLVRVYIGQVDETYTLLDEQNHVVWSLSPKKADAYWGPITRFDPADWEWDCPTRQIAVSWWELTIPPLPEGTYTLVFTTHFKHPVTDGLFLCRDVGGPVPKLYRGESVIESTIVVSAAP